MGRDKRIRCAALPGATACTGKRPRAPMACGSMPETGCPIHGHGPRHGSEGARGPSRRQEDDAPDSLGARDASRCGGAPRPGGPAAPCDDTLPTPPASRGVVAAARHACCRAPPASRCRRAASSAGRSCDCVSFCLFFFFSLLLLLISSFSWSDVSWRQCAWVAEKAGEKAREWRLGARCRARADQGPCQSRCSDEAARTHQASWRRIVVGAPTSLSRPLSPAISRMKR